jgi:hypothetical protein
MKYNWLCSIKRLEEESSLDSLGVQAYTYSTIESNVKCRVEKTNDKDLIEAYSAGDIHKVLFIIYFEDTNIDIDENDVLFNFTNTDNSKQIISGQELVVVDVDDACGMAHHLEVVSKFRDLK